MFKVSQFLAGQTVECTVGARDGMKGIVVRTVADGERYRIVLVHFPFDSASCWYGDDELVAR